MSIALFAISSCMAMALPCKKRLYSLLHKTFQTFGIVLNQS